MKSTAEAERLLAVKPGVVSLLAAVLIGCLAAVLMGCGSEAASQARIGETASNTKVAVTVYSVKPVGVITMEDGRTSRVRGHGVYAVIDLTVQNVSDQALDVRADNVRLAVGQKYWQADDDLAYDSEAPWELKSLREGTLRPGKAVRGMVLVRVPQMKFDSLIYAAEPEDLVIGVDGVKLTAPSAAPLPRIGQTAKAGGLAMTVRSVSYPALMVYGEHIYTPKQGDRLAVVDLTLKNLKRTSSYRIDPEGVGILDARGTTWYPYHRVDPALAESAQLPMKRLAQGAQARGKVVIVVPAHRALKQITYDVGVLGPPLAVRIGK